MQLIRSKQKGIVCYLLRQCGRQSAVLFLCALLSAAVVANEKVANEKNTDVKDLHYGVALYHYYQDHFFSALTELAVAKEQGGLSAHAENSELLVGGMSLSYGMDKRAIRIFDHLLKEDVDPTVRNQVWFYLAKLLYQRQADGQARSYLEKIGEQLPDGFVDEFHYLQVLLSGGDSAVINAALDQMKGKTLRSYTLFNRAMIERQQGNIVDAMSSLDQAADLPANSEENKALLDRIKLATGYIALSQENYTVAYQAFQSVRLEGPWAEQALLGYGWSASNNKDYALAIQAWNTLSQKPMLGPIVQETFVAIPHLYEKMGDTQYALKAFNAAALHYEELLIKLDEMGNQVQEQDMLERWLQQDLGEDWLARGGEMKVKPKSPYLLHMLANYQFQSSLKDLRDLHVLRNNLLAWQQKTTAYREMLATRQAAREQSILEIQQQPIEDLLKDIFPARDLLAKQIQQAEQKNDPLVFADGSDKEFLRIIDQASRNTKSVSDQVERRQYQKKLERMQGLLFWQLSEQFPARLWQAKSELNGLDDAIEAHQNQLLRLQALMAASDELSTLSIRVDTQQLRVEEQLKPIDQALDQANQAMRMLLLAELKTQRLKVRQYLAQSRLAIARIYDDYLQQGQQVQPQAQSQLQQQTQEQGKGL